MDPRRPLAPPGVNLDTRMLYKSQDYTPNHRSNNQQSTSSYQGRRVPGDADEQPYLYNYTTPPLSVPPASTVLSPSSAYHRRTVLPPGVGRQPSGLVQPEQKKDLLYFSPSASDSNLEMDKLIKSFKVLKGGLLEKMAPTFKDLPDRRNIKLFSSDDFMPPLDSMMMLRSNRLQRDRFYDEVVIGDVFCCSVISVSDTSGLQLALLCYACKRSREIDQLKITAHCSSRDIPELLYGQCKEVSNLYSVKDKVTGVVIGLSSNSEKIQISLLKRDLPRSLEHIIQLGIIRSEDLPPAYKTMCMSDDMSYRDMLLSERLFQSAGAVSRLCHNLNISTRIEKSSLHPSVTRIVIADQEKAISLRKQQSRIHALHSVVQGVKLYKEGKQMEAISCYNKALDIDPDNVEALVARGAMYANNESYSRALDDFRLALKVNPSHQNATDYTVQTLLAYARDLEDAENTQSAIKCYRDILQLVPNHSAAKQCIQTLTVSVDGDGGGNPTAEQEAVVSSTRPDTTSPMFLSGKSPITDGRHEYRSACPSHREDSERRDSGYKRSMERRRRSIMSDNSRPVSESRRVSSEYKNNYNRERKSTSPPPTNRSPSGLSSLTSPTQTTYRGKNESWQERGDGNQSSSKSRKRRRSTSVTGRSLYKSSMSDRRSSSVGSDILDVTPAQKRQRLSYSRSVSPPPPPPPHRSSHRDRSLRKQTDDNHSHKRRESSVHSDESIYEQNTERRVRKQHSPSHSNRSASRSPSQQSDDSKSHSARRLSRRSSSNKGYPPNKQRSSSRSRSPTLSPSEYNRSRSDNKKAQSNKHRARTRANHSPHKIRYGERSPSISSSPSRESESDHPSRGNRSVQCHEDENLNSGTMRLSNTASQDLHRGSLSPPRPSRVRQRSYSPIEAKFREGERHRKRSVCSKSRELPQNMSQDESSKSPSKQASQRSKSQYLYGRSRSPDCYSSKSKSGATTGGLDRYGLSITDRAAPSIDIFSQLDKADDLGPSANKIPATASRNSAASTSFLPYCLTTDPAAIKKHIVKPLTVKTCTESDGESATLDNFTIRANKGQRKALIGSHNSNLPKRDERIESRDSRHSDTGSGRQSVGHISKSAGAEHNIDKYTTPLSRRSKSRSRSLTSSSSSSDGKGESRGNHRRSSSSRSHKTRQGKSSQRHGQSKGVREDSRSVGKHYRRGSNRRSDREERQEGRSGSASSQDSTEGSPLTQAVRGKLPVLCKNYESKGRCMFGSRCKYAHGKEEFKRLLDIAGQEFEQAQKRHDRRTSSQANAKQSNVSLNTYTDDKTEHKPYKGNKKKSPIKHTLASATSNVALKLATDQLKKAQQEEITRKKKDNFQTKTSDKRMSQDSKEVTKIPDGKTSRSSVSASPATISRLSSQAKTSAHSKVPASEEKLKIKFRQGSTVRSKQAEKDKETKSKEEKAAQEKKLKQMEDFLSMLKTKKSTNK